jgi:membrane-bound serine protease (ClpP class)
MSGFEFNDDLDLDIDRRLATFAGSSRQPPLPDAVAQLPWTVQVERSESRPLELLSRLGSRWSRFRSGTFAVARLAATLAVAASFLLVANQARTSGSAADIVQPISTPRTTSPLAAAGAPEVVLVPTSGVVDDVMADHVSGAVRRAEADGAGAVVIELNTLGGSEEAMQRIAMTLEGSKVPTIVWVPGGAKAASAGTFITMSAGLAYMAQATSIGAASPVAANGGDIATVYGQTEADKTMSDAVKYMTGFAQRHHPKAVDWAVTTVAQAQSYSADQALAAQAINGEAETLDQVLSQADGQSVPTPSGPVVVRSKGASVMTINEDVIQSLLHTLDDPNIAFILLVIGVLLIGIELFHPTLLMGMAGALCLALAFYGSGSLPLNVLGVVLVVIGIGLIVLEPNVPSHGLLTLAGVVIFIVGGVAFYGSPGPYLPSESVAPPIIGVMALGAAAYGLVLLDTLMRMRRQPAPVGAGLVGVGSIVGSEGHVEADLTPVGTVYVGRESWSAKTRDGHAVGRGTHVRVVSQEGLILIVDEVAGH